MPLDPDAQRLLQAMNQAGRPPFEELSPVAARAQMREARAALKLERPPMGDIRDLTAPGPGGAIPMRLYRPPEPASGPLPVLVYFHGGGWVVGDLETHDHLCCRLAVAGRCAVISVDYRLAPEHKFPAAFEDAVAATAWVAEEAGALGLDPSRLAVGGDSAGGNLAAAVALDALRSGAPAISYQVLIYPAVDLHLADESYRRAAEGYVLTTRTMTWFRDHYLRGPEDRDDWRASPALAPSLQGLPPAYVVTAGYDPLCDEGERYARLLAEAGVDVTFRTYPGQMHGFATMGGILAPADEAVVEIGRLLQARWAA